MVRSVQGRPRGWDHIFECKVWLVLSKLQDNGRDLPHTVKPGQVSGTLKTLQLIGSALNKCIFLEFKISNVQRESSFPLDRCWHPSPMDSLLLRFTLKSCEFVFFFTLLVVKTLLRFLMLEMSIKCQKITTLLHKEILVRVVLQ